jgi:hypothetical protein
LREQILEEEKEGYESFLLAELASPPICLLIVRAASRCKSHDVRRHLAKHAMREG